MVTQVFDHEVVEIQSLATSNVMKVNGHQLKPYLESISIHGVANMNLKDPSYTWLEKWV